MYGTHPLSLDFLTIYGASAGEMVMIADDLGTEFVSPIDTSSDWPFEAYDLRPGSRDFRALQDALRRTGVRIGNLDGCPLTERGVDDELQRKVEAAGLLEATNLVTLIFDPEPERAIDNLGLLAALARDAGAGIVLEFMATSEIKTLVGAMHVIARVGADNCRLLVDLMHLFYARETIEQLAAVPPHLIGAAQVCDGILALNDDRYLHDALWERRCPGDGEYPVAAFLDALPAGIPIGVEVPRRSAAERGTPAMERAREAVTALRNIPSNCRYITANA